MNARRLLLAALLVAPLSAQVFQPVTCRNSFGRDQEIAEGDKVVAEIYKTMPVLPDTDPVAVYVQSIGSRLVAVAPGTPGLEQPWPFRFHVVADKSINAFALPGGTMFINLGAIQAAETEAQLAGVMGHEMSHVILRHATCNITRQRAPRLGYGLGQIAAQVLLGGNAGQAVSQVIGIGANLSFLKMSREDEQQADLLGAQIVNDARYDPRGLPQFFEIIEAKTGSGPAQFLSDHPNPGNRTQYINAEIAQLDVTPHPIINTDAYRATRTRAAALPTYDTKQMQAGEWHNTGLYAPAPGAPASRTSIPPPASTDTTPTQTSVQAITIAPLSTSQLGLKDPLRRYVAPSFSLPSPQSWTANLGAAGQLTLAPAGGAGNFGVAYGVYAGVARQPNPGLSDAASLAAATQTFLTTFAQQNALTVRSQPSSLTITQQPALRIELSGLSPVAINGAQLAEHDSLLTIVRADGDMDYFLFVAPERDYPRLQPLFQRMIDGIRPQ